MSLLYCTLMQTTCYASFASQESKLTILKMADMLGEGVSDFFPHSSFEALCFVQTLAQGLYDKEYLSIPITNSIHNSEVRQGREKALLSKCLETSKHKPAKSHLNK